MTATASTEAAQSYTRLQPTGDSNPDAKFALVVKPADDDGSGAGPVPGVAVSNKYIARDGPLGSSAWYASWLAGGVLVEPFKPATFSLVLSGSYADDDPTFATALAAAEACAWTATRYASDQGAYELDLRGTGAEVASLTSALSPGDANGHTLQLTFDTLGLHRVSASLDGGATVLAGDVWVRSCGASCARWTMPTAARSWQLSACSRPLTTRRARHATASRTVRSAGRPPSTTTLRATSPATTCTTGWVSSPRTPRSTGCSRRRSRASTPTSLCRTGSTRSTSSRSFDRALATSIVVVVPHAPALRACVCVCLCLCASCVCIMCVCMTRDSSSTHATRRACAPRPALP